jgi:hypothetical protein
VLVGPIAFAMFCNTDIACSPAVATSASGHLRRLTHLAATPLFTGGFN